jgi:hypothetical protein
MTRRGVRSEAVDLKALLTGDGDYLRTMVEAIVQATLKTAQGGRSWVSPCRPSPARQ